MGPFTLVRPIGSGGTSRVYLAEHALLGTRRAVKLLSPQLSQHALLVRRFVNEARAAARLRHRNVIAVHDVGQLPTGDWFMVLDYLEGDTLAQRMARHPGPIAPDAIVHIVCEIADGLQVAHDHAIVHRDLKPENVFLVACDGDPHHAVVLDFGVAQLGDDLEGSHTPHGMTVGTPIYMPPEQLRGGRVSPAADVYALGVIAYRMATGGWFPYQDGTHAAYRAQSASALYHRQLVRPPIDPRERGVALSPGWAAALLAAIDPDPAARPVSARAFALRLAEALPPRAAVSAGSAGTGATADRVGELADAAAFAAGTRYRLGARLGSGGMAEVFAGTMVGVEGFARRVAIKRVLAGLSQVPAFAAMFVAEAQLASRLAHPNIVSVLDFSRDAAGRLFLVMEYVDGKDLASVLEAGPIAASAAVFIAIELLRGLGHAHDAPDPVSGARGVIHRDVSPQNALLSYDGAVKLADFGLAKARAAGEGAWSATVRGKPRYMSPEQIDGEPLDGRTDLYAVGVMLWEMLVHRPLYVGTAHEIYAQVTFKGLPSPRSVRADVPADLDAVVMTLLARDRDHRYPTAGAAIAALLRCRDVPRDGRGEVAQLLAARFPRGELGAASPPAAVAAPRAPLTTVADPPSVPGGVMPGLRIPVAPRRRPAAARRSAGVLALIAAAVLVSDRAVAPPGPAVPGPPVERAAPRLATPGVRGGGPGDRPPEPTAERPREPHAPIAGPTAPTAAPRPSPGGARPAGGQGSAVAAPASPAAAARTARDRAPQTGELAIVVRPWAMIWLNGKPSGQTPFRAAVAAGRYHVRLTNDDLGQAETAAIVVEPGRTATLERSW